MTVGDGSGCNETGANGSPTGAAGHKRTTLETLKKCQLSCMLKIKPANVDKICILCGELIATAMLIFLGCMGCVETGIFPNTHFQMALNFGFVVLIVIQCFGCVSGAHLNPAVTLAALIYNMISLPMAIFYFIAQLLGAFIGYGLLKAVMPASAISGPDNEAGLCVTVLHSEINAVQGVFIEFLITCVLIMVCCGVWDPRNSKFEDSVAIRFGLAVSCLSITAGFFTGASMNPTRSFAPAVWNNSFKDHWIYWVGPLAGAAVTAFVYKSVFRRELTTAEHVDKDNNLGEV